MPSHRAIRQLQQTIGNQALSRMLGQRKAGNGCMQRKSVFNPTPTPQKQDTPVERLHQALGPYFSSAGVRELYNFHNVLQVDYMTNPYQKQYGKAGSVTAEIDPASASKADGSNRNNALIQAYGHLGVMERAIFQRDNLGNLYDGGHLIEHTLMEGQDADIEGNLAPQQNKQFNQGLMRGWESIPEHYRNLNVKFNYTVQVDYQEETFTRTGKQLADAGILGSLKSKLKSADQTNLDQKQVQFERWIPHAWKATITKPNKQPFPPLTVGYGSHWREMKPSQATAEQTVLDSSQQAAHTGSKLKRTHSGMLGGYVETAFIPSGNMNAVTVGGVPQITAHMYQPQPLDRLDQPAYSNNAGAYGNSNPTPLPVQVPQVNLLPSPVNIGQVGEEIYKLLSQPTPKKKGRKAKVKTIHSGIDKAGRKSSPGFNVIRSTHFRNAGQGGLFMKLLFEARKRKSKVLDKTDLSQVITALLKRKSFKKQEQFRLLNMLHDPNLQ